MLHVCPQKAVGLGLCLGVLLHCRAEPSTTPTQAAPASSEHPPATVTEQAKVEPPRVCSVQGVDFIAFRWLPAGLQLAVHVDLTRREALDQAFLQLAQLLEDDLRRSALRLPILVAFELKQLRLHAGMQYLQWQSQSLRLQSLVFLRAQTGENAWVVAHDCDVDRLSQQLATAWQLELRSDVQSVLASAQTTSPVVTDLLFGPGPRIYAAPRGEARRTLAWLSRPQPGPTKRLAWFEQLPSSARSADPEPAESGALITIEWRDEGLLSIGSQETQHTSAGSSPLRRRLELFADELRIDGKVQVRP